MGNLDIYNRVKSVPETALKTIQAGRLKGKSDINPMWRIKTLTEVFGLCGVGWKYVITNKQTINGGNNEIAAFVDIDLFVKYNGEWSEAIPGTGGSSFVANEKNGLYVSDECFKMALTDAISVACKALGVAADVYWNEDNTKYDEPPQPPKKTPQEIDKLRQEIQEKAVEYVGNNAEKLVKLYQTLCKVDDIISVPENALEPILAQINVALEKRHKNG